MTPGPTPPPSGPRDKNRLKTQGLAFGQAFQSVFKVSAMYSVDHPAAARAIQQSWDLLAPLLAQGPQFTFGFINQRVLFNTTLVSHTNLTHLEVEFTKREIATITFSSQLALKDFKRALALLTARPTVIAERGGIKKYVAENPIEGVRITAAAKPKEDGDSIEMGMDYESYLTAQAILGPLPASATAPADMLMGAAGTRPTPGEASSPRELLAMTDAATRNTIADPDGDTTALQRALTEMLSAMQPDSLIAFLPPQQQADLRGHSPGVMSARLMEDAMAGWAAERLSSLQGGAQGGGEGAGKEAEGREKVEKEILQALLRGLKATRVAERLLQKLAQFVEQANLPKEVFERIRREVVWFTLPAEEKQAQLLNQGQLTPQNFSRLVQYVQEAMSEGRISEASDIARHYFSTGEKAPPAIRAEELRRAPELLRVLASVQTLPLIRTLAEPLAQEIRDETRLHWPCHLEAAKCLALIAQKVGNFEDFEFAHKIASDFKFAMRRHPGQHADCCGRALAELLAPEALERLIESFLQRRNDPAWVRTATSLLTMIGSLAAEVALHRLEEEPAASNRLPLLRLIRGLGAPAIEATRKRLSDPRWYVVRNAAYILGDLGDPDLPAQLQGAIRHEDLRVQQAAITALLKNNLPDRGKVLAEALPHLQAGVLEMALDELTILKDPSSVEHLEALVLGKKEFKAGVREKAVIALGAVHSDRAAQALYRIIMEKAQPLLVRRAALGALYNHGSALAPSLVANLSSLLPGDPLAPELKSAA